MADVTAEQVLLDVKVADASNVAWFRSDDHLASGGEGASNDTERWEKD